MMQPTKHIPIFVHASLLLLCLPLSSRLQTPKEHPGISLERKYQPGDQYRYRLTTNVEQNGKWQSKIIAVCELKVVTDSSRIPYDEVRWISKKVITAKDTTDFTKEAQEVPPYRISLHPKGRLDIPTLSVAGMTGEITDFNTFFVAVSLKLGISNLKGTGDQHTGKEPVKGDFSNGKDILKGNDCLITQVGITAINQQYIELKSSFLPPATNCFDYLTTDLSQPVVADSSNNFQMVRSSDPGKVNILFGREFFIIDSRIQRKDGKIKQATMDNQLKLKLKFNCDERYENCQATMPFSIVRHLLLELL